MIDVQYMKWWGWGVEGVGFYWEDKFGFVFFVDYVVGFDLYMVFVVGMFEFDKLIVVDLVVFVVLFIEFVSIVGEVFVLIDKMECVVYSYGKSIWDLIWVCVNLIECSFDVVVYLVDEDEIQ